MKKSKKVFSTLAATAVLTSAVMPVGAFAAEQVSPANVLVEKDGKLYSLDFDTALQLLNEGDSLTIKHVEVNGVHYSVDNFIEIMNESSSIKEATEFLAQTEENPYVPTTPTVNGEVTFNPDGSLEYEDKTPSTPEVDSVNTGTTLTFVVNKKPTLPTTVDALVTYADGTTKVESGLPVKWAEGTEVLTDEVDYEDTITGTVTFKGKEYLVDYNYKVVANADEAKKLVALEKMQQIVDNDLMAVDAAADVANEAASNASDEASYLSEESTAAEKAAVQKLVDEANKLIAKVENDIKEVKAAFDAAKKEAVKYGATADDFLTDEELDTSYAQDTLAEAKGYIVAAEAYLKGEEPAPEVTVSSVSANTEKGITTVTAKVTNATADATATIEIVGAKDVKPQTVKIAEDGTVKATFEGLAAGKYTAKVTVGEVSKTSAEFTVEAAKELAVESVSAINAKEVTVKFSQEVDKASAENVNNYVIPGKTVKAQLQADKKSVVLTVNSNLTLNTKTSVTVNNVKSADGSATITNQKVEFTPEDTAIPSVVEVKVLSANKLRVVFSEPVTTTPAGTITASTAFKVGDSAYAGNIQAVDEAGALVGSATGTAPGGYKVYELTPTTALPVGTHKLTVNADSSIKDAAGFVVPASVVEVKVEADTTAPQVVSATALSRTQVQVEFNKPVNETTLNSNKFYWNTTGNAVNKANTGIAGTVADKKIEKVNDTTYKITFAGNNVLPVGTAYLFNDNTITDLTGNPFPTKSVQLTVAEDPKPEVTKAVALSDKIIEVHFNKSVKNDATDGALNKSFYTVKDSAGKVVVAGTNFTSEGKLSAGANITLNAKGDIATIVLAHALPADTYSITVENVKDVVNVALPAAQTVTVTPVDTTAVAAGATLKTRTYTDGTDVYWVVTFPEAMATTGNYSVLDATKWKFNNNTSNSAVVAPNTALSTITGATLSASADAKTVTIKAPIGSFTDNDYYAFGLSNFADKTGNITTDLAYTPIGTSSVQVDAAGTASTGINIDTDLTGENPVKVTSTKTVTLTLPKGLQAVEAADFAILEGTTPYDITTNTTKMITNVEFVNNANGTSTVTFTLNKDLDLTQNIAVKVKQQGASLGQVAAIGTIDADGLKLVDNKATNGVGTTVGTDFAKIDIAPSIQGISVVDGTTIAVRLDQAMTIANKGDFIVTLDGKEVVVSAAAASGKYINLTVDGTTLTSSSQPVVKTVAQNLIQSESKASKKLVANTTGLTAKNLVTAGLTLVNGETGGVNTPTAAVGDKFTVTFSEAIDPASVGFVSGDKVADGTYVKDSVTGTVTANASGSDDTITITKVGVIQLTQNTSGDAATTADLTLKATLSADGKTLSFEITNASTTAITNANFDYATFTLDAAVTNVNGEKFNKTFTPQTSSKF